MKIIGFKGYYILFRELIKATTKRKKNIEEIICNNCGIMVYGIIGTKCSSCDFGFFKKYKKQ